MLLIRQPLEVALPTPGPQEEEEGEAREDRSRDRRGGEGFLQGDEFLDNRIDILMTFQVPGAAAPSGTRCRAGSWQLESATSLGSGGS